MTIFGPQLGANPNDPYGNLGAYGIPGGQSPQDFYGVGGGAASADTGWSGLTLPQQFGVVSQGLGAFSNLASLYAGFKALSLQKKQFEFAKDSWNKNYANQVKDYENTLKDRWAARNAWAQNNGRTYESMASWVGSRALTGTTPASHNAGG